MKLVIKKSNISGLGLFAEETIPWGTRIAEYVGQVVNDKEYKKRSKFYDRIGVTYLFDLGKNKTIDGLVGGNETRFINHSKKPNSAVLREKGRIYFYSLDDIEVGDEITFDYGEGFNFK